MNDLIKLISKWFVFLVVLLFGLFICFLASASMERAIKVAILVTIVSLLLTLFIRPKNGDEP